jgi:predicted small secreted protein
MRKKFPVILALLALCCALFSACGSSGAGNDEKECPLADGTYTAVFKTDSGMFYVNEANDGRGVLTVKDGEMTIHITLAGKGIVNLFPGTAEDAAKEGALLLQPTVDSVTYSDGMTDEAYGFDVPVPALDEEFPCAILGTKGKWYDHKVSVSSPELLGEG